MANSNYADKSISEDHTGVLTQHRLNFGNDARGFTPTASEDDKPGRHGNLVENSNGDWSWKPERNKQFPQFEMPAYAGAMRGPAELYRREAFPRS